MNSGVSKQQFLHKAEVSILRTLRRAESARFSELMQPTGLTSDMFKFYVRSMVKYGWVEKAGDGRYMLTVAGKELANNIDESHRTLQKQPKPSMLLVVSRPGAEGQTEYLFQQRLRQPYYGFWGLLSGPLLWGADTEEAAADELFKQTGLRGTCTIRSSCRIFDRDESGVLLEDKVFVIVAVNDVSEVLTNTWGGGANAWMSLDALRHKEKVFPLTQQTLELAESGEAYKSFETVYSTEVY